jgi:hypothetical protein
MTTQPAVFDDLARRLLAGADDTVGELSQVVERAVALVRDHPYASAAALVALAGAWSAYETYVHTPAHLRKRQREKRRARVNVDSAFGLGFKSCPEVCSLPLFLLLLFFYYYFIYFC